MDWQSILTIVGSVAASSGVWALIQSRLDKRSGAHQLLLGLAHDRIIELGMTYIERGWVTKDEYDDLNHYLWKPYSKFGGNGLADKVKRDVDNLPIYGSMTSAIRITAPKETQDEQEPESPDVGDGNE